MTTSTTTAGSLLVAGEEALAYLELRAELYEIIIRVRLLQDLRPKEAEPRLSELATAITAAEEDARERRQVLPIEYLRGRVGLGGVAEDILLLAVCAEVDPRFGQLLARYQGSSGEGFVSIGLCQLLLGQDRRSRLRIARLLRPGSPLLDCGLLSLMPGGPRHGRPAQRLAPAPYLPSFILGDVADPEEIQAVAETVKPEVNSAALALPAPLWERAWELVTAARPRPGAQPMSGPGGYDVAAARVVLLSGPAGTGRRILAMALAHATGHRVIRVACDALALLPPAEAMATLKLLVELAWFGGRWLLLEDAEHALGRCGGRHASLAPMLAGMLRRISVTVLLTAPAAEAIDEPVRELVSGCLSMPAVDRRRLEEIAALHWTRLGQPVGDTQVNLRGFVEQRALTPVAVRNAVVLATHLAESSALRESPLAALSWAAEGLEPAALGALAARARQSRSLADLVLPQELTREIQTLIQTARVRGRVHQLWGLDRRPGRGVGLSCLFWGDPGTGKTLAAEVVATEVGLPLHAVNLAEIVSPRAGETAKNLSAVFAEAARNRCVLLFEAADALLWRRNDRNGQRDGEVDLWFELMEAYDGITICTTNRTAGVDHAFERRFGWVLHFPTPDAAHRLHIWRLHLPPSAPVDARLRDALVDIAVEHDLPGGSIRACVLRAAYRAAVAGEPVNERHLREAIWHVHNARTERV